MHRVERSFWAPSVTSQFCVCPIPFHFDTYRGCQYGCLFCFARDMTRFARRKSKGEERRQGYIVGNSPEGLSKWCNKVIRSPYDYSDAAMVAFKERMPLKIGATADPFPMCEVTEHITYECLRVLARYDYPTQISSKNPQVFLHYADRFRNANIALNVSCSFCDDDVARQIETGAISPTKRFEAIRELSKMGYKITVRIQPFILPYAEKNADRFIKTLADIGAYGFETEGLKLRVTSGASERAIYARIGDALGSEYPPQGMALVMTGEHLCYDRETEILTNSGFKYFRDLKDDDLVAQYDNEKDEVSFVKPQEFVRYHYNGKMVRFNSMSFDLMVTPEHRTLYLSDWERYHTNKRYHFANAKDRIGKLTVLPTAAPYEGRELSGKTFGAITFEGTDFCEFMGYYLSEGWSGEVDGKYKIAISQDIRSKGFESIKNLLSKYGFAQVKQSETKYHFTKTNKELGIYLSQFGRSADKFIPAEIKNASIEQRKIFLRAYYLGDGFTHKKHGYSQITTISSRMADDLQELLCLCGISASISERKAGAYDIILHKSKNGEWKKCAKLYQNQIYEEDYDGEVYCVNVPTTALVVRRNKHIAISGNCKTMRGAKKKGTMTSSFLTGVFKTESALRAEFMNFVNER